MNVVVTGGTTRLGKAIADHLREKGWRVVTTSHRADAGADVVADFAKPGEAVRAYLKILNLLDGQPPDALVNNAALFTGDAETLNAVNLEAPKKLTTLMASRESGVGSVVNILDSRVLGREWQGSGARSPRTPPAEWGQAPYEKTKLRLFGEMRHQAAMFAETLRVNAVAPGPVLAPTGMHEKAGETPLGRPTPHDVAEAVAFLLTAKATTGAILPVDGGQSLGDSLI